MSETKKNRQFILIELLEDGIKIEKENLPPHEVLGLMKIASLKFEQEVTSQIERKISMGGLEIPSSIREAMEQIKKDKERPVEVRDDVPPVGTKVRVLDGGKGAKGADGMVGDIVTRETAEAAMELHKYHGEYMGTESAAYVSNGDVCWGLCPGFQIEVVTE